MSSDRARFFKELLRGAAQVAQEVNSVLRPPEPSPSPSSWEPEPFKLPEPRRVGPVKTPLTDEALAALCREVGLEQRLEDVRRFARRGARLTVGDEESRSRLGGSPDLPAGFEWPTWEGRELGFLGQIALDELPADCTSPLPSEGLLLAFYDFATLPSGLQPDHADRCRVVLIDAPGLERDTRPQSLRPLPVQASCELMLPGAWTFGARPLDLTPEEAEAWEALRARAAAAQGVELEEDVPDWLVLHRLLGYHEELGREVEVDCELVASGVDVDDYDAYFEHLESSETRARSWRLLLQLSTDSSLRTPWSSFGRLYFFIREDDLRAGNFAGVRAILR